MLSGCPVCEEPLAETAAHCASCGYPSALREDALRAFEEGDASSAHPERPRRPVGGRPSPAAGGAESQVALCERTAKDIGESLPLLQQLGGDNLRVTSTLSQAALVQADGRLGEALSLLRSAQSQLAGEVHELFDRRLGDLERRQTVLLNEGVAVDVAPAVTKIRSEIDDGRFEEALGRLLAEDGGLTRLESDWRGLRGLLQQIEALRAAAAHMGRDLSDVESDLAHVRDLLGHQPITVGALDEASQMAAKVLILLHEALPQVLEEELERHGVTLGSFPPDHEPARRARSLHSEANRHLKRGRLVDASSRLSELRLALRDLTREQFSPPPVPPETPARAGDVAPPPEAEPTRSIEASTDLLAGLLKKARELASRVRVLPPDSEVAFEAAGEIRRATELLRARKLEEAEVALSRLMRTLDTEPVGEE